MDRYNGTPRGLLNCNEGGCTRCNHGAHEDACLCLHAEENALLEAGRERIDGATLYCNTYAIICYHDVVVVQSDMPI